MLELVDDDVELADVLVLVPVDVGLTVIVTVLSRVETMV